MSFYRHLRCTVQDKGVVISDEDYNNYSALRHYLQMSPDSDFYISLFKFTEEFKTYFDEHNSIKGYNGVSLSNRLVWDLDSEQDVDKARIDAIELLKRLQDEGVIVNNSIDCYFSGGKGFHIELLIDQEITPEVMKMVCSGIARELPTFDSVIYNNTRCYRIPNTKHGKTRLYKVPIDPQELLDLGMGQLRNLAAKPRITQFTPTPFAASTLISKYHIPIKPNLTIVKATFTTNQPNTNDIRGLDKIDFRKCPKNIPRCIYALQFGVCRPGERQLVLFRLATYYRNQGLPKEVTGRMLKGIAELNARLYPESPHISKEEVWQQAVASAYKEGGNFKQIPGAVGISADDNILQKYCECLNTSIKCTLHHKDSSTNTIVQIDEVADWFSDFAKSYDKNIVKTGIAFFDDHLRMQIGTTYHLVGCNGCHRKGEQIRMFDGTTKLVEDIIIGDQLMGPDSTPRTVLKLHRGKDSIYKIDFNHNKRIKNKPKYYNGGHILYFYHWWKTKRNKKQVYMPKIEQMSIEAYLAKFSGKNSSYRTFLIRQAVEYTKKEVLIDPYFLGLWLGDGSSKNIAISTTDLIVREYTKQTASQYGLQFYNKEKREGFCPTYVLTKYKKQPNQLLDCFKYYNLMNNKHIPLEYKANTKSIRLQLLAGLLDTDGYMHNNCFEIVQKNKRLAYDIQEICLSLGFQAQISECMKTCQNGYSGLHYRLHISGTVEDIPVKLDYKQPTKRTINKNVSHLSFNISKESNLEDYYGFEVDKDHLYLDDDYIITHNSGKTTTMLNTFENSGKLGQYSTFFSLDMDKRMVYLKLATRLTSYTQTQIIQFYKENNIPKMVEIKKAIADKYSKTFFDFSATLSLEQMRDKVLTIEERSKNKMNLVVVDFAGRISGPYSDKYANACYNALKASEMAKSTDSTWLFIHQISRSSGDVYTPLRSRRVIKESGDWEDNAAGIINIWRPYSGNPSRDNVMRAFICKNKMGSELEGLLFWDGAKSIVRDMTDDELLEYDRPEDELKLLKDRILR